MITFILGKIFISLAALFLLPLTCAIIYKDGVLPFIIPIIICLALGFLLTAKPPKNREILAKEGFVCVGLAWILMSAVGCLPFIISGAIPSFIDAFFETVSGFTTTGSSVLSNVEALDNSLLLWRSFTQWIGGMGVLVFLLALMPKADSKNSHLIQLMKAEVPGPTVSKIVPRLANTARVLYGIYILLTAVEVVFLVCGEMNFFEAINHSFTTASTGGFGIKNDSVASYSAYSQYVIAVFMTLCGINLNVFYLILTGHFIKALKGEEIRLYLVIITASVITVTLSIFTIFQNAEISFRTAFFQVVSIITTSGFATADYAGWPVLTHVIIITLMFCGGCAGSTSGGIKLSRLMLLAKNGTREIKYITHPRAVVSVKLEGKRVDHETVRGATSFIIMYAGLFLVSTFLVTALDGCDLVTGFTSVCTALNNVGPGLGEVGPTGNFADFSVISKLILCFDMLAGRLELFPILILFAPSTWKKFS
jgi:trk system potassium uptake protein TrkH